MKSGLSIRSDNAASVLEALKELTSMDVLVGIPASNAAREDSPLNNAEIGYLQSTGATIEIDGVTVTLPPRPFLDMGLEDTKPRTTAHLKAAARAVLDGDSSAAMIELESAGQIARDGAKAVIGSGDRLHPLSEKTIERRRQQGIGGEKPLYAHGFLLNSITYVVRKK
ncbi:hypothetical protein MXF20_15530 [Pantoea dispersa]|uniref:hypothetical protein n=1 Tax=Pantoea dispersa TaxID=59814 RepID=UPI002DB7B54E|nr:hypothetical protein [Pantoea dispersa]MEB5973490.1 hypothetical protein [Pantoea dispersa]